MRASTLLLILPRIMTMQLAKDSVKSLELGILITAVISCGTAPGRNTPYNSATYFYVSKPLWVKQGQIEL